VQTDLAPPPPHAPEAWPAARRLAERVLRPVESFLHVQAASGIVLLLSAVLALAWANSPWAASYEHLWHTEITLGVGSFVSSRSLHFWVNDGMMTVFFLVVGLEIRREIHEGELADVRRAALPIAAALGGMIVPALLYLAFNHAPPARAGWGVPMATDIAFAVGVLALLGPRVPPALRVLLLALAIIDDIGAIIVIAAFYSSGVAIGGFAMAAGGVAGVLLFQRFGVRRAVWYLLPGAVVWAGFLRAGVHPTIAGVVLGLLTPVRSWLGGHGFLERAKIVLEEVAHVSRKGGDPAAVLEPLRRMSVARREAVSPVVRLQAALHTPVAFGVMPLFAVANAGVSVAGVELQGASLLVMAGVVVGLVVGKPIGVLTASFLAVRTGLCTLPRGVTWSGVMLVGAVAGIGFTMAIFIAGLAFPIGSLLAASKLGVLAASAVAGGLGLVLGRVVLPARLEPGAALTAAEAEAHADR
jgi:NhaA family Na+:H+ antiporter